jgi:hypothetical protein
MNNTYSDLYVLKALFNVSIYNTYKAYIEELYIKNNNKELYKILQTIHVYYNKYNINNKDIKSIEELESLYYILYPSVNQKDKDNIHVLFDRLSKIEVNPNLAEEIFLNHVQQVKSTELAVLWLEVAEGKKPYQDLIEAGKKLEDLRCRINNEESADFVPESLESLERQIFGGRELTWRLNSLNASLGPLRGGDFGFVFARPNSGKTTWLASELSNFLDQVKNPIVWFNNEEQGAKVKFRIIEAYFSLSLNKILQEREKYGKLCLEHIKGKIKVTSDNWDNSRRSCDRICSNLQPSLIVFDQIDKIRGFEDDRYDLEMKEKYGWARQLAKKYGPVIGVCQAGGSGEGKQYLNMDDVDSSRTSKQGEADWILGIGKSHQPGLEHIRFFNICKNKLLGGKMSKEELRHARWQVRIWPEISRYEDI